MNLATRWGSDAFAWSTSILGYAGVKAAGGPDPARASLSPKFAVDNAVRAA